jgi:hypothetical protein
MVWELEGKRSHATAFEVVEVGSEIEYCEGTTPSLCDFCLVSEPDFGWPCAPVLTLERSGFFLGWAALLGWDKWMGLSCSRDDRFHGSWRSSDSLDTR